MKQLIFMVLMTLAGTGGTLLVSPMLGVSIYYVLAVLRPQYLWVWTLPPGIAWSYYVALATIAAGLTAWFGGRRPATVGPWPTLSHRLVLLFGAWVGLTYFTAYKPEATVSWAMEYAKLFIMFFFSMVLIRTVRHVWVLFVLMTLTLGYLAYEFNYTYLTSGLVSIHRDGYGGYDNNAAALMLALGLPMCYFAWEGSSSRYRWGFLALVPVLLHAVLMSYSRGAMVSLLAVAPLVALRARHRGYVALFGLVVALMVPVMAGEQIRARFLTLTHKEEDDSVLSRRANMAAGFAIACDHPILGVGVRNSNLLSHQYGADFEGRTIHCQYLLVAAENGFVGLVLYLLILFAVWRSLLRTRREMQRRSGPNAALVLAMVSGIECALVVFCVGGSFLSLDVFEPPYLLFLLAAQLEPLTCPAAGRPAAARSTVRVAAASPAL